MECRCKVLARHDVAPVMDKFGVFLDIWGQPCVESGKQAHAVEETDAAFAGSMLHPLPM